MTQHVFLGRQPILDRNRRLVAYELLFRASATAQHAVIEELSKASVQVIATTFSSLGVNGVLGECRGFFNISREVLLGDVLEALPCDRVVLEILENVQPSEVVSRRCRELHEQGFLIALDDYVPGDPREAMLDVVDLVKVDLPGLDEPALRALVGGLRNRKLQLLAEKVETPGQFETCRRLGFDFFQGYFFARPVVLEGSALDPERAAMLELLRHVSNEDGHALAVETLKRNVNLSIKLLNLVNSAAMPTSTRIGRIDDALRYLGSRQLQRWVSILLFAEDDENGLRGPLFQLASWRGRLMELVAERCHGGRDRGDSDRAFLVGMLSLADVLLSRPIDELTAELNLDADLESALVDHGGPLGELLELVIGIERLGRDGYDPLQALVGRVGLDVQDLQQLDGETYCWIHSLVDKHAA